MNAVKKKRSFILLTLVIVLVFVLRNLTTPTIDPNGIDDQSMDHVEDMVIQQLVALSPVASSDAAKKQQQLQQQQHEDKTATNSSGIIDSGRRECAAVKEVGPKNASVQNISPIWVPSFPGSGAEMFRSLVKTVTGLGGAEIYAGRCGNKPTVTCKTHWPSMYPNRDNPEKITNFHNKTFFLIRNPRNSIPSYFNYKWELKNHIKSHSAQAPESKWREWRDTAVLKQLRDLKDMISRWEQLPHIEIALYIQYEKLIDDEHGPILLQEVVNEIQQVPPAINSSKVHVAPKEDVPCLWQNVVKGNGTSKTKRSGHKYKPSYTPDQKQQMLNVLDEAIKEFSDSTTSTILLEILQNYRDDIKDNMPLDEPDETHGESAM